MHFRNAKHAGPTATMQFDYRARFEAGVGAVLICAGVNEGYATENRFLTKDGIHWLTPDGQCSESAL